MSNLEKEDAEKYCTLKDLAADEAAVIDRFSRNLEHSANPGVLPGETAVCIGVSLDKSRLKFSVDGRIVELPLSIAENIWCKR